MEVRREMEESIRQAIITVLMEADAESDPVHLADRIIEAVEMQGMPLIEIARGDIGICGALWCDAAKPVTAEECRPFTEVTQVSE